MRDLLLQAGAGNATRPTQPRTMAAAQKPEDADSPVTRGLLESLFATLTQEFHTMENDIKAELRELRRDIYSVGERVDDLENQTTARDEEVSQLQQKVLRLRDQQLDLQAHAEDLENRSRRNNICIRAVPQGLEEQDIEAFVMDLFRYILGGSPDLAIKLDRTHQVGLRRSPKAPPPDI